MIFLHSWHAEFYFMYSLTILAICKASNLFISRQDKIRIDKESKWKRVISKRDDKVLMSARKALPSFLIINEPVDDVGMCCSRGPLGQVGRQLEKGETERAIATT